MKAHPGVVTQQFLCPFTDDVDASLQVQCTRNHKFIIEEGEDSTEEDADDQKGANVDLDLEEHNVDNLEEHSGDLDLKEQTDTGGAAPESLLSKA